MRIGEEDGGIGTVRRLAARVVEDEGGTCVDRLRLRWSAALGEVVGEEGAEACREEGRGGELGVVFGVHGSG